jgi:hypothetical protein
MSLWFRPTLTYVVSITQDVCRGNGFAATHSDSEKIPIRVVTNVENKVERGDLFQPLYFGVWRKGI